MITLTHHNGRPNVNVCDFVCDSLEDLQKLPTMTSPGENFGIVPMGSTAIVNNGGTLELYILFTDGWVLFNTK